MKDSELLKKMREVYTSKTATDYNGGEVSFGLCRLIMRFGINNGIEYNQWSSLSKWVLSMTGRHSGLGDWLYSNGYITDKEYDHLYFRWHTPLGKELKTKLFNTRIAWLDWMIAECEKAEAIK